MKRVALYVRVSTEEQKDGYSVDNQIDALRKYCSDNGLIEHSIYNDAGHTARKSLKKRSELMRLVEDCKSNKFDLVIFTKLDRWFRNIADYYEIQKVLDEHNVKWKAIWEDYETETSAGVFKVNIMLAIAQAEADRTSERIKAVNTYRREVKNEYTSGKAATGYIVKGGHLYIDQDKQEGVKAFFNEYLSTFNLTKSVKVLHDYGVNVRRDTARRMLNNTAYCGNASGYQCEPYITEEDFNKIQDVLSNYKMRKPKVEGRTYIFSGALRCAECGAKLHGSIRKMHSGKNIKVYKYYRCPNNRNMACSMSRSKTEILIEKELIESIEDSMNRYNVNVQYANAKVVDNSKRIASLNDRLDRLVDLYEMGDISRDDYLTRKKAITKEISELNQAPEIHTINALPDGWRETYNALTDESKKAFWLNTMKYATLDQDGILKIHF